MSEITRKDLIELRGTYGNECAIQRFAAMYSASKEVEATTAPRKFLNLPEEETLKYLKMLKETCKPADMFDKVMVAPAQRTELLKEILATDMQNEELLESLYEQLNAEYDCATDFAVFCFYDVYDIPKVNKAKEDQDESEDVWKHITVMLCPVTMEEPGIVFSPQEGCFKYKPRRWQVGKAECAFTYPALINHEVDHNQMIFYSADPEYPHVELSEDLFKMDRQLTATQFRKKMESAVHGLFGNESDTERIMENFAKRCDLLIGVPDRDVNKRLDAGEIEELLKLDGIQPADAKEIIKKVAQWPNMPLPGMFATKKLLKGYEMRKHHAEYVNLLKRSKDHLSETGEQDLAAEINEFLEKEREE